MIPKSYDRMSRRGMLLSMAGLNPWLALRGHPMPAGAPRPNIVVLLSDDMGWEQVGFNGGKEVPTPNIDRIAHDGVKMSQFYVQPVCTSSLSCLLTGRYAWKTGTERRPTGAARQGMGPAGRRVASREDQGAGRERSGRKPPGTPPRSALIIGPMRTCARRPRRYFGIS